ncbi:glycine betaine ABC transporter substrate-binding protein [Candidatus Spongiihabitans sp.]|uniref:glycine betaine ABC transporter substrate-binding protein n=1 Tax=Candidatus Spongiihabitans sp. TaxID=3101308 RepID=UPI003C7E3175
MKIDKSTKKTTLGLALLLSANVAMADCGDVQIAEWNWASGELMANVDKIILEAGYGCNVELIPGATTTTFASMNEKGQPDIAGELWINAVREPLGKAFEAGSLHSANSAPITGLGEGWWIPPHTAKKYPELKTVLDVLKRPDLFPDAEDKSKGAFVGCPAGWGCQLANANLFRAFEMEKKGWKLVDPGSAAGLDGSMTKAVERGQNWFGYYWSPTAMIGKHKMVKLDFGIPFAGSENWDGCIVKPEQECADPKPSSWTNSEVYTVVTDKFKNQAGAEVMGYLGKRVFPGEVMNGMLVYMADNQAEGADAAAEFLLQHGDLWETWVDAAVASKVKASL